MSKLRVIAATKGDTVNGMGHVSRQLVLARALSDRGVEVVFSTDSGTPGAEWLARSEFDVRYEYEIKPVADAIILDYEHGPTRGMLERVRPHFAKVIVVAGSGYQLQDAAAVCGLADLRIYQGLHATPEAVSGAEHILIDPRYAGCRPNVKGHIVVSMGGGDPHNLTNLAVSALTDSGRELHVIYGPAYQGRKRVGIINDPIKCFDAPSTLVDHMHGASLFVGAFGTVAWEALAAGVPCVLTGWSADHVKTAEELGRRAVAVSLGLWSELRAGELRFVVGKLLEDREEWWERSKWARQVVDGQGAGRVADKVCELIKAP